MKLGYKLQYKGSIKKRLIGIIVSITLLTGLIGYSSFLYWYINKEYIGKDRDKEKSLNLNFEIDVTKFDSGVYFVVLNNGKTSKKGSFIKK